jgi:Zn-dependent protease with chaperone function
MNFFILCAVVGGAAFAAGWCGGVAGAFALQKIGRDLSARQAFALAALPLGLGVATLTVSTGAFLLYEPRATLERPGMVLLVCGTGGVLLALRTAAHAVSTWSVSRRVLRDWRRSGQRLSSPAAIPVVRVETGRPIVAVGGLVRAALYIDRCVLDVCSRDEIEAIAAHELAHVRSGDNLKRLLLAATRGPGHALVSAWHTAAEAEADRAAASDERSRLVLASALIKVSRFAMRTSLDGVNVSGVHDGGSVVNRVRALLEPPCPRRSVGYVPPTIATCSLIALAPLILKSTHRVLELLVNYLP